MDAYGDKVTKTTSTDIFGDRKTTTSVRDVFGDTSKTSTYSDPYGDKITKRTTTDIFGDRRTTTSVRDAFGDTYKTSTFSTPADVVVFEGAQLPVLVESHLRALDRARLRAHAQLIYRSLSGRLQILDPAVYSGDLVDWVLQVQGRHLDPLRTTVATAAALGSPMAAAAALDYVMFEGARLPLFAERHLRTLDRIRLREHAQMLYRTLGSRYGILAPELYDGDLADWILQVQGRHLEPLKTKTSYMDAYGDKVTKTTSTDIFGDRKTTTSVRDVFGDTSKSTTYSDPYGDKITTKTTKDIFGDRKTTTTVRDAWGDKTSTTTATDAYGDKMTTRTSKDIFGNTTKSTIFRDAYGDKVVSASFSGPLGRGPLGSTVRSRSVSVFR